MPLPPRTLVGRYELIEPVASGRLSEVYRARDSAIDRTVAVKLLAASLAEDPAWLKRFDQEARAAGRLDHPNILSIHDVGTYQGRPYLVSEWLEGETLRQRLALGEMPWRKAAATALQISLGIAAAHDKGIVHRDLKPENVFLTRDGRIKILDLGLAMSAAAPLLDFADAETQTIERITQPGAILGTVGYMSPEQVRGQPADVRSDIFSLGAILYEMAAGKRAFHSGSPIETLIAILREDPAPVEKSADIPPALESIFLRCIEKNPQERFQSARDLAYALEDLLKSSARSRRSTWTGRRSSVEAGRPRAAPRKDGGPAGAGVEAEEESCFHLVLRDREIALRPGENIVGRGHNSGIRIESSSISRQHARILVLDAGPTVEDLDSKNGTFVRGKRVRKPTPLADGDEIRMGSVPMILRFRLPTATTETGSEPSDRP